MSWLRDRDDENDPFDRYDDESAVRVRPNPKGNRPRSKRRPAHREAEPGRVLGVDRGRFQVLLAEDTAEEREVTASRAREVAGQRIVTGDRAELVGDTSGEEGTLCRIVRVSERSTLLRRSADDTDTVERVIVANADQLLIVVAATNPEPRARLIDRYLVAAFDAGIRPILCVTKTDLTDPQDFLDEFSCLDLEIVLSGENNTPVDQLRRRLAGHSTVAVGHSGVGKSTLVNALVPGADRATGVVNAVTGRGRHTSSNTTSLRVTDDTGRHGWIIDTPGIRSFGLGHVHPENVLRAFANLSHPAAAPADGIPLTEAHDWEIIERVEAGELGESGIARIRSMKSLLDSIA